MNRKKQNMMIMCIRWKDSLTERNQVKMKTMIKMQTIMRRSKRFSKSIALRIQLQMMTKMWPLILWIIYCKRLLKIRLSRRKTERMMKKRSRIVTIMVMVRIRKLMVLSIRMMEMYVYS